MRITILGCGALGQIWLSALSRAGHDMQGWLKVPQPQLQIKVFTPEQDSFSHVITVNDSQHLQQCELLLVTLKAQQLQSGLTPLLSSLPANCPIVLMHNGLGVMDDLPALTQPLCHAVTTQAAYRTSVATLHKAWGITQLGPLNHAAKSVSHIADVLHQALPDVAWYDEIKISAWKKLAVNAVINPLTVKYDCHNGQLMSVLNEVNTLCRELATVMNREGIHTDPHQLFDDVVNVIQNTSTNISSMRQDIQAHRLTEIDYINGYLLKRARCYGLTLAHHTALYQWIKQKESEYVGDALSATLPRSW
ncbi:2-dehydropantoate 2-reductase [Rosenbergiella sp. S61]|uniref:2-dehydropantoate 2-reductase n=1 Tax=Rosenbergiella gaditana TaxID=2726987 RepID=A0ABS5SXF8_9GAMM|nr:2-dehydropantoate 2-reductase [Rosenbergiella gaditana]MBT0724771.1 2-dehydropantoate 2-reductase [Rosenbergiella gaditana]